MSEAAHSVRLGSRQVGKFLAHTSIVFTAYMVAGRLGQATINIRSGNLGPVWPAYGVALAAILLYGYRAWVGIAIAAFLVAVLSPVPPLTAVGQAAGATLGALFGAFLLFRITEFRPSLSRLRDVLALICIGALGSALVSASIGVSVLYATHLQGYSGVGSAWLIYWLGDSTGVLLVVPLVLTSRELLRIHSWVRIGELAELLLLLTVTCFVVFGDLPLIPVKLHVLAFAVLPFVTWAAIRFAVSGAALTILVVATIATVETALGSGPFALNTPFTNAVLLDVFFAVLSVSGLTLAAAITEREKSEREREQLVHQQAGEAALAAVSHRLIEAQEQERSRIARELHDDIGQRVTLVALALQQLHRDVPDLPLEVRTNTGELWKQTSEIASDIQSLSHDLHSPKLEYLGLAAAARSYCKEFSEQQKMQIDFEAHDLPSSFPPDISLCLFRVLQEALHNSAKHSGAQSFQVKMWGTLDAINLVVSDSGIGFDPEVAKKGRGLGLVSMKERLKVLNGTLSIKSSHLGSTIHAQIPAQQATHGNTRT